jgi:hypothetical protein
MNITPEQALNNLYAATRMAPLPADQHELLRKSAETLADLIKPKEEDKK